MIFTKLKGLVDILGASWIDPIRSFVWGGATGGGDYLSPISFTATAKGTNQAHITGVSPTITNVTQFRYVRAYNADNSLAGEWWPSRLTPFLWNPATGYLSVKGADWGSCAYLVIEINAEHRAYVPTEDAYQDYQVNSEHAWTAQGTNAAAAEGNGATTYYYDVDMYKYWAIQIDDTPGVAGDQTYVVSATWQDDGTAQAACSYLPIMTSWWGFASVTSAQITADAAAGELAHDTPLTCKYIRLVVTRANDGANTDGAWDIYNRSTY